MNRSMFIIILTLFFGISVFADELPRMISYQGVLTDVNGNPVSDGNYNVTFSLYNSATASTPLWSEGKPITVFKGVFKTMIGDSANLTLPFNEPYWLGFVISGGSELMPRVRLGSSPYSIIAASVADSNIVTSSLVNGAVTQQKLSTTISSPPVGAASGDLLGTYPAPTVFSINGIGIATSPLPINGQVLKYGNGLWAPRDDEISSSIWSSTDTTVQLPFYYAAIGMESTTDRLAVKNSVGIYNSSGISFARAYVSGETNGVVRTNGPSSENTRLSWVNGSPEHGFIGIYNDASEERIGMYAPSSENGILFTRGANNSTNVVLASPGGGLTNHGALAVYDDNGTAQAGMYVNANEEGVIWGDIKNFRMTSPTNPNEEIWYASLEGPEASAYQRGSAALTDGFAVVLLPDHFSAITTEQGMTVTVTPLDASSEGLAVVHKSAEGFEVRELNNGSGSYPFDWEVKAVRKGFEDYQVVRPQQSVITDDIETVQGGE